MRISDWSSDVCSSDLGGTLFVSVKDSDKSAIVPAVRAIIDLGFKVIATVGTADYLAGQGLDVAQVNKVAQGRPHIVDRIKDGEVDLIFNTTEGGQSHKIGRAASGDRVCP